MHVSTEQARADMGHTVAAGCILDTYFKVFKSEWWFVSGGKNERAEPWPSVREE